MSVRNLEAIFRPRSIALIGASNRPHSIGQVIAVNLLRSGFSGPIMPVNPKYESVGGVLAYRDIQSLPVTPDLAVICTPPATVPGLIAELGERGTKGAIVITAGFGEARNAAGKALQADMLNAARPHLLRIIGPNCLGVLSSPVQLNASFAQRAANPGKVAFIAQSGAIMTTVLDWAAARSIGFSHMVSLGDMADVDFGDMLDYLATDNETGAILLYVEAITHARKFMSAARAAARMKPVIAIKTGRTGAAAHAATSHTGALAGMDSVYDAAFARAGILRAFDLDEIFDAVETLSIRPRIQGDRLAILTNGGGAGVLAADALTLQDGQLAELGTDTLDKLNAVLPPIWSHGDPVDIIGDADGARYAAALDVLTHATEADAVLVLNCPTALASGLEAAKAVTSIAKNHNRPILTNWLGSESAAAARRLFSEAKIPSYETPERAVRGFMHLVKYGRRQDMLMEVPPSLATSFKPDTTRAREIIDNALAHDQNWLDPVAVQGLLDCYRIATAKTAIAKTPDDAAAIASTMDNAVALKILSPDITHKSDVGGVVLALKGADAVRDAAAAMTARVREIKPDARIEGFVVQEMVRRAGAFELIAGMASDTTFGPFLLFGQGGTAVEMIADKAIALPPLNMKLAHEMISSTRIWRQLKGFRNQPAADIDAIAQTLVQLSQMVCDLADIVELDINPLLADAQGVMVLDTRIRIAPAGQPASARLAIRPYPHELEHNVETDTLGTCTLRPVRPEDAPLFTEFFDTLNPQDARLRFFSSLRSLPVSLLARLTQIDYDREMAFLLFDAKGALMGVVRYAADPDNAKAEFAVLVHSKLKGHGLGRLLMDEIVSYARMRGIGEIFGDILDENVMMLALARDLGCTITSTPDTPGILRASLKLQA